MTILSGNFWQNYKIERFPRAYLYKKGKDLHVKIQDTVSHINESMVQIKKAQKYSCLLVLSITSF